MLLFAPPCGVNVTSPDTSRNAEALPAVAIGTASVTLTSPNVPGAAVTVAALGVSVCGEPLTLEVATSKVIGAAPLFQTRIVRTPLKSSSLS